MRQIVMDTETTGIDPKEGHRIIEIGAVEVINRRLTGRTYHQYINPQRAIDPEAMSVHGITDERVANEPVFGEIAEAFWAFIEGAELVIHNAPFDVGFMNAEFTRLKNSGGPAIGPVETGCGVLDTLKMARNLHPGQRNSLDALCKRYDIDNSARTLHGALLDSEILAEVYLAMTGGQTALMLGSQDNDNRNASAASNASSRQRVSLPSGQLRVIQPSEAEWEAHQKKLEMIRGKSGGECVWDKLNG